MDISTMLVSLLLMLTVGGQPSDLLDILPTQSYWQAKHVVVSTDAMLHEVSATIADDDVPGNVRRLMAIRTLGELKDAKALMALKTLLDSKRRFEADYAQEAIYRINGKAPSTRPAFDPAIRKQDLAMLPTENTVIGQISRRGGHASIDALLITHIADVKERQEAADAITEQVMPLVEKIGNVRIDGVTLAGAISGDDQKNVLVVILHGSYNAKLIRGLIPKEKQKDVGGVPAYSEYNQTAVPVSDDRLIFIMASPHAMDDTALRKLMLGPDRPATVKELDDLAAKQNGVDVNKPVWLRVVLPQALLQQGNVPPAVAQTKDFILTAEYTAEGASLHGVANCANADDARVLMGLIRAGTAMLNVEIAAEIQRHPERAKAVEVWQTFLNKLKMETKDTALHADQVLTPELLNLPFSEVFEDIVRQKERQNKPDGAVAPLPPGN